MRLQSETFRILRPRGRDFAAIWPDSQRLQAASNQPSGGKRVAQTRHKIAEIAPAETDFIDNLLIIHRYFFAGLLQHLNIFRAASKRVYD